MLFDVRSALRSATGIAAVLAAVLLVSACGRRGPLEPPPDASATAKPAALKPATAPATRRVAAPPAPTTFGSQDQTQPQTATLDTPDDETEEADQSPADSIALTPTPTAPGTRKRNRAFHVPNEPFILDPLL